MRIQKSGNTSFREVQGNDENLTKAKKDSSKAEDNKSQQSTTINKNNKDNRINKLIFKLKEIQKGYLEERRNIIASKIPDDLKEDKLKEINDKIKAIEDQIIELETQKVKDQIEKKKQEAEKKQEEIEKRQEKANYCKDDEIIRSGVIISKNLDKIIEAKSSLDKIHILKEIKNRGAVEAGYMKLEIDPNAYVNKRMSQIRLTDFKADLEIANQIGKSIELVNRVKVTNSRHHVINKIRGNDDQQEKIKSRENTEDNEQYIGDSSNVVTTSSTEGIGDVEVSDSSDNIVLFENEVNDNAYID